MKRQANTYIPTNDDLIENLSQAKALTRSQSQGNLGSHLAGLQGFSILATWANPSLEAARSKTADEPFTPG